MTTSQPTLTQIRKAGFGKGNTFKGYVLSGSYTYYEHTDNMYALTECGKRIRIWKGQFENNYTQLKIEF